MWLDRDKDDAMMSSYFYPIILYWCNTYITQRPFTRLADANAYVCICVKVKGVPSGRGEGVQLPPLEDSQNMYEVP